VTFLMDSVYQKLLKSVNFDWAIVKKKSKWPRFWPTLYCISSRDLKCRVSVCACSRVRPPACTPSIWSVLAVTSLTCGNHSGAGRVTQIPCHVITPFIKYPSRRGAIMVLNVYVPTYMSLSVNFLIRICSFFVAFYFTWYNLFYIFCVCWLLVFVPRQSDALTCVTWPWKHLLLSIILDCCMLLYIILCVVYLHF